MQVLHVRVQRLLRDEHLTAHFTFKLGMYFPFMLLQFLLGFECCTTRFTIVVIPCHFILLSSIIRQMTGLLFSKSYPALLG
jgi:hypothetical protein